MVLQYIHGDSDHPALLLPSPQLWPFVSNLAKDFIQHLLAMDRGARLTTEQAIRHPWVVTMAASSSMKNLHRSISQNLWQGASRTSSPCPSSDVGSGGGSSSVGLGVWAELISLEVRLLAPGRGKHNDAGEEPGADTAAAAEAARRTGHYPASESHPAASRTGSARGLQDHRRHHNQHLNSSQNHWLAKLGMEPAAPTLPILKSQASEL